MRVISQDGTLDVPYKEKRLNIGEKQASGFRQKHISSDLPENLVGALEKVYYVRIVEKVKGSEKE